MTQTTLTSPPRPDRARDPDRFFRVDELRAELPRLSVRAGAVTFAGQTLRLALTIGQTMALARLLTPDDHGLVAMVTAFTYFFAIFQDLGLSQATVQRPQIDHRQVSALFWINASAGLALSLFTAALAPALAWFYGKPQLLGITLALAPGFLAAGLAAQHVALLRRQMQFRATAALDLLSLAAGAAVGLAAAARGAGYWALALAHMTSAWTYAALAWGFCAWRPGPPRRGAGVRPLLAFGGGVTAFNVMNYCARNVDNVLVGRLWGAGALGLYSKAYNLLVLPLQVLNLPLASVAQPGLSRLATEPEKFRVYYLHALALLTSITIPAVPFLLIGARELMAVLLGPGWEESAAVFSIFGILVLVQPVCNTAGWLYVATGRIRQLFRWGVWSSGLTVAAFVVGTPFGPRGVAAAYTIAFLLLTIPCLRAALAGLPIRLRDVADAVRPQLVAALPAALAGWLAARAVRADGGSPLLVLAACAGSVAAVYLAVLLVALRRWRFYVSLLRHLFPRER